ncbi:hypothetical protein [Peribacillus kribbensis]|uniref:hypothetical protein n=1 Tax=Peribacillus kribbensis TaxID=356658 RepID=UPI0003FA0F2B
MKKTKSSLIKRIVLTGAVIVFIYCSWAQFMIYRYSHKKVPDGADFVLVLGFRGKS